MRASKKPRTIKAEQILIGDTIRVSWAQGDTARSTVGKVAHREYANNGMRGMELLTKEGHVLCVRDSGMRVYNASGDFLATLTLIHRQADTTTPLDGIEL